MEKQIYTIALDKERKTANGDYVVLDDAKPTIEIVWSRCCTEKEALEKFEEIINEQSNKLHVEKTISEWRTIRLYDGSGRQIRQES